MVYEAVARSRDPVYGSTGAVCQLQRQVDGLMAQLLRAQAELAATRAHRCSPYISSSVHPPVPGSSASPPVSSKQPGLEITLTFLFLFLFST